MGANFFNPTTETITIGGTGAFLSIAKDIRKFKVASFHIKYSANLQATFKILAGNDESIPFADTGTFVTAPDGTITASFANISGIGATFVQLQAVVTGNPSNITVVFSAKE